MTEAEMLHQLIKASARGFAIALIMAFDAGALSEAQCEELCMNPDFVGGPAALDNCYGLNFREHAASIMREEIATIKEAKLETTKGNQ